jgi:transcriptional regulator with XRE-family HTH domain
MTPFGQKLRELRQAHGKQLKDMAKALRVSSAYLSALEHGHRARPKTGFVQQVAAFFNLAWEDVDELKALADLSDPKVSIDTGGLSPLATELANRLAKRIGELDASTLTALNEQLKPK